MKKSRFTENELEFMKKLFHYTLTFIEINYDPKTVEEFIKTTKLQMTYSTKIIEFIDYENWVDEWKRRDR
jgi:hypothetical protein